MNGRQRLTWAFETISTGLAAACLLLGCGGAGAGETLRLAPPDLLPARSPSPGHVVYTVDPENGDDANAPGKAWKTFRPLQDMWLAPGDRVEIHPGKQPETLRLLGGGSASEPVTVRFLPGTHLIGSEKLLAIPLFISNSMDSEEPRPIAIMMDHARHFRLEGAGPDKTLVLFNGRVVQILNDHAEDVAFSGLTFDLERPSVSEFRVLEASGPSALIQIAERSDYAVEQGKLRWKGDWGPGGNCNEVDLKNGWMRRRWGNAPRGWSDRGQDEAAAIELGGRRVRLEFPDGDCGLQPEFSYHFQSLRRDRVGVFNDRARDIVFRDCRFHALTGMGFVSQFTENITFQRVDVAPPAGTIRTHVAWADIFHFSNCRGEILIDSCRLSGMQDDAMNVHGTNLLIAKKPADNQFMLTYQHRQTYGFPPYAPGDELAVVNGRTLREYLGNPRGKVVAVERRTSRNWLVTFEGPAPQFQADDVADNVTWHPNVTARNNHISVDAVRGFLLTTRGKIMIESNTFQRCAMSAILMESDSHGWCESGPVRDALITRNRFIECGVWVNPQTPSNDPKEWVHENIRIVDNYFREAGIKARSVRGLVVTGNRSPDGDIPIQVQPSCTEVQVADNDRVESGGETTPNPVCTPGVIWLDQLRLGAATQGWGEPRKNHSVDGNRLTIGGKTYSRGFGTHAESILNVSLGGEARSFTASVGVDDEVGRGNGRVEFLVIGDGKTLWSSGVMQGGDAARICEVELSGVKKLTLEVGARGRGIEFDHADWADARFQTTEAVKTFAVGGSEKNLRP